MPLKTGRNTSAEYFNKIEKRMSCFLRKFYEGGVLDNVSRLIPALEEMGPLRTPRHK